MYPSKMNYFSIEIVTLWINATLAVTEIVLVVVAFRALDQISQQRKQNELTRETVAINELRHFEEFVVALEDLNDFIRSKNVKNMKLTFSEMQEFTLSESHDSKFRENLATWHLFYKENTSAFKKVSRCANKLEVIATALEYGTAKLEVIEDPIAFALCTFVEDNAYVYIRNRNAAITLYPNTIKLYKKLKPKVQSVSNQLEKIEAEIATILKK